MKEQVFRETAYVYSIQTGFFTVQEVTLFNYDESGEIFYGKSDLRYYEKEALENDAKIKDTFLDFRKGWICRKPMKLRDNNTLWLEERNDALAKKIFETEAIGHAEWLVFIKNTVSIPPYFGPIHDYDAKIKHEKLCREKLAACSQFAYGGDKNLLELQRLSPDETVVGYLEAKEALRIITNYIYGKESINETN